ncbi:hypothetical protein TorRG33x02_004220 [Trema orientale]|uniref:Nitrate regulatory gene2 protein n=1 Tax=Trema orientale TaxID=63057 RepID=A0A2P5G229_TREOI|nr:hypothetical protein TorRG33x02_004220 [Trema orientale]
MGCVASRIDKEERVQVCRQRKRLMKQLVGFRGEFADAQLAYLRALKNTGVTLRQFTESESLEIENTTHAFALPPSPPPPLPPSPPPPPPLPPSPPPPPFLSADLKKVEHNQTQCNTPLPRPILSSSWESWDLFSSPPYHWEMDGMMEPVEEENWAETKTEFEDDELEEKASTDAVAEPLPEKPQTAGSVDDNSSTMSWYAKERTDAAMVLWRSKKTLEGLAKELDDYFLKASAGVKEITVLMDIRGSDRFLPQNFKENTRKRCNTAKVFSALSWSWSSKSLQFTRDSADSNSSSEPCRPGAHCITIKKLYDEEQKLYREVKEEVITKSEHERKSSLLRKQEEENHDWTKTDRTRMTVESLEADITRLQQSISRTCSSILELIDDELYPQLVAITSGLLQMWRTMYESHQAQYQISQRLNHLGDDQKMDLSTAFHRQAAVQLETEVICWYNSFCRVVNSQREYVRTLCRWIKLTDILVDDNRKSLHSSAVHNLCDQWQLALDRLPDKVTSEAIKSLCSAIHSIILQQEEEHSLHKKYEKIEKRLQKELESLAEMERKLEGSLEGEDRHSNLSPKHPLTIKHAKTEALKKQVENENIKYLNSVQATKAMTLNNLKTGLPNVFKALVDFSCGYVEAIEACLNNVRPADSYDAEMESTEN